MKILGVRWFCSHSTIGIVRVEVPFDGIKYYIGGGSGMDERVDIEHIAAFGSYFPNDAGDLLFGVNQ